MNILLAILRWIFQRPQPKKRVNIRVELFPDEYTQDMFNRSA